MGIIVRQTLKSSVYSYIGAILGFINVGLLMPLLLQTNQIGLINVLVAISSIIGQFGTLGFTSVTTRLFPYFRDKAAKHHGFFSLLLKIGIAGFILCMVFYFLLKNYLIAQNIDKSPLLAENVFYLAPLIFFTLFFVLLDVYNRVLYNAAIGAFTKEFLFRILVLAGLGLYYFDLIDFMDFLNLYIIALGIPVIVLAFHLLRKKEIFLQSEPSHITPELRKEIINVAIFGLISGFSGIAVLNIDRYMVNHFFDLDATGIYATAFYFGALILIPGRNLRKISATIIADAFREKNMKTIGAVYYKSTINQLIIAVLLFCLLWANVHNVFRILPESFVEGKWVMFYIGVAYCINMLAGVSSEIIQNSKRFRLHAVFLAFFIIIIVLSNYFLIPEFGIRGAAMASAISYVLYVLIRYFFLWSKFGMQPYNYKHILIIVIAGFSYWLSRFIPVFDSLILDIIIRSAVICILFIPPVLIAGISYESNVIFRKIMDIFRRT